MFQRGEITQSMFSGHNAIMLEITDKKIIFMCLEKKEYTSKGLSIPLSQRGNHSGSWKTYSSKVPMWEDKENKKIVKKAQIKVKEGLMSKNEWTRK